MSSDQEDQLSDQEWETPDATPEIADLMADPVRWRAYSFLRGLGPSRADVLGLRIGVNAAVLRRHLRAMSKIGFVREVDPSKTERYRRWEGAPGGLKLTSAVGDSNYSDSLFRRWLQVFLQAQDFILREWMETESSWSTEIRRAALNYDHWMHLTVDELDELSSELHEVTSKWYEKSTARQRAGDASSAELLPIYVVTHAVPVDAARDQDA